MKKISAHSKTSLFLMEMIFVLLFWHFPALPVSVSLLLQKTIIYRLRNGVIYKRSQLPS